MSTTKALGVCLLSTVFACSSSQSSGGTGGSATTSSGGGGAPATSSTSSASSATSAASTSAIGSSVASSSAISVAGATVSGSSSASTGGGNCLAQTNPCNDCITPMDACGNEYDACMAEPACAGGYGTMLACICAGQIANDQKAIDACQTTFDNASNSGSALTHCIDMTCNVECGF